MPILKMPPIKLQRVMSPKHPGAIFFKIRGTNEFVCKFYPNQEKLANEFYNLINKSNQ